MRPRLRAASIAAASIALTPGLAAATDPPPPDPPPPRWAAPFGGEFHASFTLASDYSKSGISGTENQPALQVSLDWRSPTLFDNGSTRLWGYLAAFGTNVSFPGYGAGEEIDLSGGLKLSLFDKRLAIDVGYIRYLYPGYAGSLLLNYSEYSLKVDYDFGPLVASGRLRYSPDTLGDAGFTWEKRGLVSVPLPFLPLPEGLRMKLYGSLGNFWVEKPALLDLPGNDYWFWQIGVVGSFWGLDLTVAYTDTNIEVSSCAYSRACSGRIFASVTKVF